MGSASVEVLPQLHSSSGLGNKAEGHPQGIHLSGGIDMTWGLGKGDETVTTARRTVAVCLVT